MPEFLAGFLAGPRRWLRSHPAIVDTAIAAVLVAEALLQAALGISVGPVPPPDGALAVGLSACAIGSLAWRRVAPVTVVAVQVVVGTVVIVAGIGYGITWGDIIAFVLALYSVAAYRGLAYSAAAGTVAIGHAVVDMLTDPQRHNWGAVAVNTTFLIGAWFLGRTVRLRRAYLAELTARAERLERAREADARAARAEERSRIARELHDVVAHHVSVMTVQAGAARRILDRDPDGAVEALSNIERMGRTALGEMRRVVGVLRVNPDGVPSAGERSPQPGIVDIDALVHQLGEAGLEVSVRVEGTPRPLSPGVDLAAYRLVQEALTNTLKHAGRDVRATVVIRYGDGQLAVRVEDDGRAGPLSAGRAAAGLVDPAGVRGGHPRGHGLVGMRERVSLYGGDLRVGPRTGGGFEVAARFPLEV